MPVFSTHFKSDGISISVHTTRIYNGKTMPNLETSSKKLHIIRTAIRLFTTY
ncbi:TetR family transcriptional regulator, partial [Acinetobacter baumannii]